MTSSSRLTASVPASPPLGGEVFDIGYQRYSGPREGRAAARRAVYKDGIRAAFGIGRGGRAKILPWLFITAAIIPALVLALIAGTVDRLAPGANVDLPSHGDYYGIAAIILLIFSAVVGPELLCPDRRNGVINLYLVRPLTGLDYAAARWIAFFTVMLVVAWFPQVILLAGLTLGGSDPAGYLVDNWVDVPRFLGAGFAIAAFTTTLALTVAGFTTRRAYAAAFVVALFVVSLPFAEGLSREVDPDIGRWLALLNVGNIPLHLNDMIFGSVGDPTRDSPAKLLGNAPLVIWYILWVVVPGGVYLWRYRRLTL